MKKNSDKKIFEIINNLHNELRNEKKKEWDRVLPFEELLFDRWEKAKFLNAKKGTSVYHSSYIFGDVNIGKNTWIGPYTILDASGGMIKIGDFCSISTGVQIYTHDSVNWSISGGKLSKENGKVTIGNNCYVGPNTIISKGVTIGNRCIIGAQSLVNKDVKPNSIIYGTPGRVVGKVKIKNGKISKEFLNKEI